MNNISTLPYELQFKYLLPLSYKDIIQYCQTATTPLVVCRTQAFWELKAKREFGITGYISVETPDLDFAYLEETYDNSPSLLLPYLIRTGQIDKAEELLSRTTIGEFIIGVVRAPYKPVERDRQLDRSFYSQYEIEPVTIELFETLLDINDSTFASPFISHIGSLIEDLEVKPTIILLLFGRLFELTINKDRYEWIALFGFYVNPGILRAFIGKSFQEAISQGDVRAVMYFESEPSFKDLIDKVTKVRMAIKSGNQIVIDYYLAQYPEVLTNVSDIDLIVKFLIPLKADEPLETMLQIVTPEILKTLVTNMNEAYDLVEGWLSYVKNKGITKRKYNYVVNYYNKLL